MRSSAGCRRWRRRQGDVSRMPFWKRRRWMRTRKRKRWRALVSFLTSVHVVGAGTCKSAAFALVNGSAPLHTMSLSSIQTHGLGPGAWHPLDPSWVPLPVPGAGKIYWGHGVRGLASPDPLVGATQHVAGCTWCGRCTRWHASLVTVQFLDKVVAVPVVVATGAVTRQGR